ncbi:pirin family protein [Leptospira santarosai]|uniref:Pirin family protein n=2 Tax=Leptospira santarosai TaxID=28183 RepID=M6ULQ3_9LEPT|nr:pirin family protein [Leptospira santarosai]AVV79719.1 Pirin [Leptospira santarosai]EMF92303.1 pirin family protein [Leptospira santarosai str. ST188]EMJ45958.1 pirin family protein [Leptospira santarosai str. HAI1349]EMM86667.1 pirin family protein [Leptospira santarosai str. 2000027870]EMO14898.1 pirin family protein [Leptospira santarosai str. CBC523]
MNLKKVKTIRSSLRTVEGGGFPVRRPFPVRDLIQLDPFLLLDEMGPVEYKPGKAIGAPEHPHRGFETVTYLLTGEMEHRDSWGNYGKLKSGDVQWMTAGSGLVHSELPSNDFQKNGGRMHGFQLWVNLPSSQKMSRPRYQDTPSERIPEIETSDGKTKIRVIAGEVFGTKAVIETKIPILYYHFRMIPGADVTVPVPESYNAFVFPFSGDGTLYTEEGNTSLKEGEMVWFERGQGDVRFSLREDSPSDWQFLLIGGEPVDEPVARYGPFVMNTQEEISQAFYDFHAGKMGAIHS